MGRKFSSNTNVCSLPLFSLCRLERYIILRTAAHQITFYKQSRLKLLLAFKMVGRHWLTLVSSTLYLFTSYFIGQLYTIQHDHVIYIILATGMKAEKYRNTIPWLTIHLKKGKKAIEKDIKQGIKIMLIKIMLLETCHFGLHL